MMNQQQKTDPGTAKPDNTAILDALITRAQAGNDTASLTSPVSASLLSAEIASNSAIMNILIQQELQKRALLGNLGLAGVHLSMASVPNSVQHGGTELLHSLLLQRSMLLQQQQQQYLGRVLPPTSSGLGLGLPVMNSTARLLNHDALSTNGLLQLLQQRQQPGSQQMLPSSVSGLPSGIATAAVIPPIPEKRKGRTGTFPQKLYQMLQDLEKLEGGTDIAAFLPHGRAFAIHDPKEFVKSVMPKYFRMSRFSSFQRQLNLYEFNRITDGPNKGSYYHELFMNGRPDLCTTIKRNKIKSESSTNKIRDPFGPMGSPETATIPQQVPVLPLDQGNQAATSLSTETLLQTLANRGVL
jgi:HSF-type DNA-binding